jgi:hypothetical protein
LADEIKGLVNANDGTEFVDARTMSTLIPTGGTLTISGGLRTTDLIAISGNFLTSDANGNIVDSGVTSTTTSGLQTQITNNDVDISLLQSQTTTISGDLDTLEQQFTDLDLTYATDANLAGISANLQAQITSNDIDILGLVGISGNHETRITANETFITNIDLTYATDVDLVNVSGYLQAQITSNDIDILGLVGISGNHEARLLDLEDITDLDAKYVDVTGDTMTGNLNINADLTITAISGGNGVNIASGSLSVAELNTGDAIITSISGSGQLKESGMFIGTSPDGGSGFYVAEYTSTPTLSSEDEGFLWVESKDASTKTLNFFDGVDTFSVDMAKP